MWVLRRNWMLSAAGSPTRMTGTPALRHATRFVTTMCGARRHHVPSASTVTTSLVLGARLYDATSRPLSSTTPVASTISEINFAGMSTSNSLLATPASFATDAPLSTSRLV